MSDINDEQTWKDLAEFIKCIPLSELPEGAYTRYLKDIWYSSGESLHGESSFEEWRTAYENRKAVADAIRDKDHPIEHNHKFQLTPYVHVTIFKRKGEDWSCSICDMSPAGGCGNISLEEAMETIENHCEERFERESLINPRMVKHSGYICPKCGEVWPNAFDVVKDIYPDSFCNEAECPKCGKTIKSRYGDIRINGKLWPYETDCKKDKDA